MDDAQRSFHKREQALRRKHIRMSQGYMTRMNRNGVIEQVPQSRMSGLVILLYLVFIKKTSRKSYDTQCTSRDL